MSQQAQIEFIINFSGSNYKLLNVDMGGGGGKHMYGSAMT